VIELDERARKLIGEPNLAHLATLMADGSPHVTPVWVDLEGDKVLVNTARGRVKDRNMRRDPRVALSLVSVSDPYERVSIRGRVVDIRNGEEADRHIDELAKKYMGVDVYPNHRPDEQRLIVEIEPESIY
jgi:PPOX class probable F420-dependent enzyme